MYQEDYRTSVSMMRTREHVNNPRLSGDMTVLGFEPGSADVPPVRLIDRECDDLEAWQGRYGTLVQSIRMVSCTGRNVWSPQERRTTTAAIGTDASGRVLFVHSGAAYRTHELIDALLELPIDLERAMYAEGGVEAQLYVNSRGREYEFAGGTGAVGGDGEAYAFPVPNVVGVARREQRPAGEQG